MVTLSKSTISRRALGISAIAGALSATRLTDIQATQASVASHHTSPNGPLADFAASSGVKFSMPSEWEYLGGSNSVAIGPSGLDQNGKDRLYILINNYTHKQLSTPGAKIVECSVHAQNASLASWVSGLREQLALIDPYREFRLLSAISRTPVIETYGTEQTWQTAYLEREGSIFGVTLVRSGSWMSASAGAMRDVKGAFEHVIDSLSKANRSSLISGNFDYLGFASEQPKSAGSFDTRKNKWKETVGDGTKGLWVDRSVKWSDADKRMKRNTTECRTTASRNFAVTLVRSIITDDYGTCQPRAVWSQSINKDCWQDNPLNHVWTGSWKGSSVGSRTIFFSFLMQPGIWYCLDHWTPF